MALDAIDHFLLGRAQRQHEGWLQQNVFQTRALQEQLADQAANQGHLAILRAVRAAYNAKDWPTVHAILSNYETRNAIYQAAYLPTYESLKPV